MRPPTQRIQVDVALPVWFGRAGEESVMVRAVVLVFQLCDTHEGLDGGEALHDQVMLH